MNKLRLGGSGVSLTSPRLQSTRSPEAVPPGTDFGATPRITAQPFSSACTAVAAAKPAAPISAAEIAAAAANREGAQVQASPHTKPEVAFATPSDSSQSATRPEAASSFASEPSSMGSTFSRLTRSDTCGSPRSPR
eukprot:5585840-Prymnesium_polylepis.1